METETKAPANIQQLPEPPGSFGMPMLGETLRLVKSPKAFINERMAKHGRVFKTHVLGAKTVYLLGPDAAKWIFEGEDKYLQNEWSPNIQQLLGHKSVAMINGPGHRTRRRLLSPTFNYGAMRRFVPGMTELIHKHMNTWDTNNWQVRDGIRALTFEIAAVLIIGDANMDMDRMMKEFRTWVNGFFDPLGLKLPFTPFGKALKSKDYLMQAIEEVVRRRMAMEDKPDDLLTSMVETREENGDPLDPEAIVHEVKLQLFAGHDTTVTALTNLMHELAKAPEVMTKLIAEQEALAGKPLDLDTLRDMKYLTQVIQEGMRIQPPIQAAFRVMLEDKEYDGYKIPKGWKVAMSPYGAHYHDTYQDAHTFDPDRMGAERQEQKAHSCAYVPFGGGPRVCLGQHFAMVEMTLIMALFLRRYKGIALKPGQNLDMAWLPFPAPKSGVLLQLEEK